MVHECIKLMCVGLVHGFVSNSEIWPTKTKYLNIYCNLYVIDVSLLYMYNIVDYYYYYIIFIVDLVNHNIEYWSSIMDAMAFIVSVNQHYSDQIVPYKGMDSIPARLYL